MIPILKGCYRKIQGETGTLHDEAGEEGTGLYLFTLWFKYAVKYAG